MRSRRLTLLWGASTFTPVVAMINIVYRYLNSEVADEIRLPESDQAFVWSRAELPDADAVVYCNEYSYTHGRVKTGAGKPRILFIAEPVVVHPPQYSRRCWKQFDAVIACNPLLAEESDVFHYLPVMTHGSPFPGGHGVVGVRCPPEQLRQRPLAVCQIVGAKFSLLSPELYSLRRDIATWFHQRSSIPFDVFGRPAMAVPNYRGGTDDKLATTQQYRYALCLENSYHPRWTHGYLTEKMFDSLYASTVPIYQGCANVEDYVPLDCFIDYRQFDGPAELEAYLKGQSVDDYLATVDRIWRFLDEHRPDERYHYHRLYRLILEILAQPNRAVPGHRSLPEDFIGAGVSFKDRVAFHASCAVLRHESIYHLALNSTRWFQKQFSRKAAA